MQAFWFQFSDSRRYSLGQAMGNGASTVVGNMLGPGVRVARRGDLGWSLGAGNLRQMEYIPASIPVSGFGSGSVWMC